MSRPELEPTLDTLEAMHLAGREELQLCITSLTRIMSDHQTVATEELSKLRDTWIDRWNDLGVSDGTS
jgi:hypothetical protein